MVLCIRGKKTPLEERTNRPADTAFKQQKLRVWRPILSPTAAIATFATTGLLFVTIGIALAAVTNQVVEVESTNYAAVCTTNPCYINVTVTEKMVAPIYLYYKLSNFYQNHRNYVRDREDAQLAGESGLTPSALSCTAVKARYPAGSAGLAEAGWEFNSMQNVVSPCGRIASSVFNDSFRLSTAGGAPVPISESEIAWETDRRLKFQNAADGSTGRNFAAFNYWRSASCDDLPDTSLRQPCLDAANSTLGPVGWCFPGSGYCAEDEHFIIWMRTAGLPTFRKLFGTIAVDLEPGVYRVQVSNGVLDPNTGLYMKQDLSGPQEDLYPVSVFGGTKAVVISTLAVGLGGKNPFLGLAYIAVGVACIVLAVGFWAKHRISPRALGTAPFLYYGSRASRARVTQNS